MFMTSRAYRIVYIIHVTLLNSFLVNTILSQKLKVAFRLPASMTGYKSIETYLQSRHDPDFRILRMITEAMDNDFETMTYNTPNKLHANGSWTGAIGLVSRSEVDIVPELFVVTEQRMDVVHYSYPFRLYSSTFVIEKPEYTPQVFGILKAFSLSIWITLILFAIAMVGLEWILMNQKFALLDVLFNVFAICFKQAAILKPRTLSQNLLTYNWIAGTMFLDFCYTSVLLSFLTFPSVSQIRTMQDLAEAVENDGYNCMFDSYSAAGPTLMAESNLKPLAIIGENMLSNIKGSGKLEDFIHMKREKIAYFNVIEFIPTLPYDHYFVSQDSVSEGMAAMILRKDFCCKDDVDVVIHRIMAAGLHAKVRQDTAFLSGIKLDYNNVESKSVRKLTSKNFLLAFTILLFGHVCSLAVLVIEVVLYCLVNRNHGACKRGKMGKIISKDQINRRCCMS